MPAGVAIIAVSGDGNWVAAMRLRSDTVLRRLLSISRAIAGQMDYQSVLEAFAAELQHLISHDHADIVVLAKDGEEHLCYEVGLHTAWSELSTKPQPTERYADNFFSWVYDFNGDKHADVLVVGFPGTPAYVYENPGPDGLESTWKKHRVFDWVSNESPQFISIVGDGQRRVPI